MNFLRGTVRRSKLQNPRNEENKGIWILKVEFVHSVFNKSSTKLKVEFYNLWKQNDFNDV